MLAESLKREAKKFRQEGMTEGIKQSRVDVVLRLKRKGLSLIEIAELLDISLSEVALLYAGNGVKKHAE